MSGHFELVRHKFYLTIFEQELLRLNREN
uniref:Uncharacterized protein n=1 Tax=Arundo donax TaxID=35708 RepID=A0A0A9GTG4_ARUDO